MPDQRKSTGKFEKKPKGSLLHPAFFVAVVLYGELLLRAFDSGANFFAPALFRVLLFSVAAGLGFYFLMCLIPWGKVSRILAGALIVGGSVYLCVAHCCQEFFGTYYGLGYMLQMTDDVVGDFSQNLGEAILQNLPFILLSLLPIIAYLIFCKRVFQEKPAKRWILLIAFVVFQVAGLFLSLAGAKNQYTYDFQVNNAVREFGAVTTVRLEMEYLIFGTPEAPAIVIEIPTYTETEPAETDAPDEAVPGETDATEPTEPEIVYGYNVLPIDFEALAAETSKESIQASHKYFASLTPSQKNEYTGMFAGKNLILITAEAFSPYVISEELTPTLYKLATESFVFNNYYQPDWHQSTAGGEFAVLTGLAPSWVGSQLALNASAEVSMPYTLGWAFQKLGYKSLAYHNNTYTYYGRHNSHPNFGYEWTAVGNGLKLENDYWPNSDLEMILSTADSYIQDYVENGQNFHTYYMTVSGHANYNWGGNHIAAKNKEIAQAAYPNASTAVQAYIACNLELEYAMTALMEKLEAAGIADETVIVLTSDHYPYGMTENYTDYYNELTGLGDTVNDVSRYKNSLLIWSGSVEETIVVDTPCSSIDVVPTLCNLFGIEYDSRLFSGRDVFATNYEPDQVSTCMPLVIFPMGSSYSWITAAGTYDVLTNTFTPNEGITVGEEYVEIVSKLVSAKFTYAKKILQQDYYGILLEALKN